MRRILLAAIAIAAPACAHPEPVYAPAPNPTGCYVDVYDTEDGRGVRDVFNGPTRWSALDYLPHTRDRDWSGRIRSVRVGPAATLVVYSERNFHGGSLRMQADSTHFRVEQALGGRVQSLEIACVRPPPACDGTPQ
jgi:hypothetical protein